MDPALDGLGTLSVRLGRNFWARQNQAVGRLKYRAQTQRRGQAGDLHDVFCFDTGGCLMGSV